jgi:hypothetical protein
MKRIATQASTFREGNEKLGGMTPMTVYGASSSRTERPSTPGSAPNCLVQRACERMTVPGAPPASSAAVNVLPSAGRAPRSGRTSAVMAVTSMRRGSPRSTRFIEPAGPDIVAPMLSKERLSAL